MTRTQIENQRCQDTKLLKGGRLSQRVSRHKSSFVGFLMMLALATSTVSAQATSPTLEGIGYREQELQVAKGDKFQTEVPNGVEWASFAGGTHIFIKGQGLDMAPLANTVQVIARDFSDNLMTCPPLTDTDSFNSNPKIGAIAYRLPSMAVLFGKEERFFDNFSDLKFYLQVLTVLKDGTTNTLTCPSNQMAKCELIVSQGYTPVTYYLNPPVLYFGAKTEIWFDPKNVPGLISEDLPSDEMQFINVKINDNLLDFEGTVQSTTRFGGYAQNKAAGVVGIGPTGDQQNFSMLWEVGLSDMQEGWGERCNFDSSYCYFVKTLPKIDSISASSGYQSGGQTITVKGYGFLSPDISATADGIPCDVKSYDKTQFTCVTRSKSSASVDGDIVGQSGVSNKKWSGNKSFNYMQTNNDFENRELRMDYQGFHNTADEFSSAYEAWFTAPITGKVRFYASCYDDCKLNMNKSPGSKGTPEAILEVHYMAYRNYWLNIPSPTISTTLMQDMPAYTTSQVDQDVLTEHNSLRTTPQVWVDRLTAMLPLFGQDVATGLIYDGTKTTVEGAVAVQAAIDALNTYIAGTVITDAMVWDQYLEMSCKDLVTVQSPTAEVGSISPDGTTLTDRIAKFGTFATEEGEGLAYGAIGAQDIVLKLLISDGDTTRASQTNLLNPEFKVLGANSGTHSVEKAMACVDYAGGMVGKAGVDLVRNISPQWQPETKDQVSGWIDVVKDSKYFLQGLHVEREKEDWMTVGIEIERTVTDYHTNAFKELQEIEISVDKQFEETYLKITERDETDLKYILRFQNPNNPDPATSWWNSKQISTRASAAVFKKEVEGWYWDIHRNHISVSLKHYDVDGFETDVEADQTSHIYTIKLSKMINGVTTSAIEAIKSTSKATFLVTLPADGVQSFPPLNGHFTIKCPGSDGNNYQTKEISTRESEKGIEIALMRDCYQIYNKIEVWNVWKNRYYENGRLLRIRFTGYAYNPGLYEAEQATVSPATGTNVQFRSVTILPFSHNLMYESIPFEMLNTYETKPQMIVNVGTQPAVCAGMNCDYKYHASVSEITDFMYTELAPSFKVEVWVTPPIELAFLEKIMFGGQRCMNPVFATDTKIECDLPEKLSGGKWQPKVYTKEGEILLTAGTTRTIDVAVTITAVAPATGLNPIGMDTIVITGTSLPTNLDSIVEIEFQKAGSTRGRCLVIESTATEITCITNEFTDPRGSDVASTFDLKVLINGDVATSTGLTVQTKAALQSGVTLSPMSASPVLLNSIIDVNLDSSFPEVLTMKNVHLSFISKTDATYVVKCRTVEVNDSTKTFKIIFSGAVTGDFHVEIFHDIYGLVDTQSLTFQALSTVTNISPSSGSIYGGTLITITGTNFGSVYTDNPVKVLGNGFDDVWCYVEKIEKTEIKCRVEEIHSTKAPDYSSQEGKTIVFQKASEETGCVDPICKFTFTDVIPTITAIAQNFNQGTNKWEIKVTGTGFTGIVADTQIMVNGVEQITDSINAGEAVFSISNIRDLTLSSIKVYFGLGLSLGTDVLDADITLTPKLIDVTPSIGSIGGSNIILTVEGVGKDTKDLIVENSSGDQVCSKITILEYGKVECLTKKDMEMTKGALKITIGSDTQLCGNSDSTKCEYQQLNTDVMPKITSVSKTDATTLVITGTNFWTTGYNGIVTLVNVAATTVTIDSATQVTATWRTGVPNTAIPAPISPNLSFEKSSRRRMLTTEAEAEAKPITHWASGEGIIDNILDIIDQTPPTCSFAGGCDYEINAVGLASLLSGEPKQNYVNVCSFPCTYSESSTVDIAKCKVPAMPTLYSNLNYNIAEPSEDLPVFEHFGSNANFLKMFDNDLLNSAEDSSSNPYIGVNFRPGFVGLISQVRYYIQHIDNKAAFQDLTVFQGSMDGVTYTDLFTIDETFHEGWNYHKWETPAEYPSFQFYRFQGAASGGVSFNEVKFTGVETSTDDQPIKNCEVEVFVGGVKLTNTFKESIYSNDATPKITSILPRYGSVTGGTILTIQGEGFDAADQNVIIDMIPCAIISGTSTELTCTTGPRPGIVKSSLDISFKAIGNAALNGNNFVYVSAWSETSTWGGDFPPAEMESIHVPIGMNLLVDIDDSPKLNAVIVEGSIIFLPDSDPNHQRTFDSHYLFLQNGTMEVGTEQYPYTSKITFTMHSELASPYLPIYGNKVLANRFGTLDMHGIPRTPTWTFLETTATAGSSTIILQVPVDWKAGELIAIASTGYDGRDAEKVEILSVAADKKTITLTAPLAHKHFAATQTYGTDTIDMRAEVGLLSRNIKFRGEPLTSNAEEYGGTIFSHSTGDDSLTTRLSHIELTDTGQAFKVGRYSIHFHMIGAVHTSYIRGVAVHEGFNRALTIHGTTHLRIEDNVVFRVKGHAIFIEDGAETKNIVTGNLVMNTQRSMSLLNTDQTPACFWITHPDNVFINNSAAGSDRYGFWYDLQKHSIGPSANTNICPENTRVGEFRDNIVHSMGRYGLRIFHNMIPRKYPCRAPTGPTGSNPLITTVFNGLIGYKCNRNGAIAERVGNVQFENFKVADNLLAGIEFSLTEDADMNMAKINGALIIGKSDNTEDLLDWASPHGIITPRTENFMIENVKFYNFNFKSAAALGTCSHCFHSASTDSGARTVTIQKASYDAATVPRRFKYQTPYKAIFLDLDGTTTQMGENSWATPFYSHHEQPECHVKLDMFDGVTCNNKVQVRRIAFYDYTPKSILDGQAIKIAKYEDDNINNMNELSYANYVENKDNFATVNFKDKLKPSNGWAVPFVTGHKYRFHFGKIGTNFENLKITQSEKWEKTDRPVYLVHNFSDVRAAIDVQIDGGDKIANETIKEGYTEADLTTTGHNIVYNDSDTGPHGEMGLHLIFSGKDVTPGQEQTMQLTGHRCIGTCLTATVDKPIEDRIRLWSVLSDWEGAKIPEADEDVLIVAGWNMFLDIPVTPELKLIQINGRLTFKNDMDIELKAKHIFVRAGELVIGSELEPYEKNGLITLYGAKDEKHIVYDNAIEAGNKLIANVGLVTMYGKKRTGQFTRLTKTVTKGDTTIQVEPGLDWVTDDRIALLPTSYKPHAYDDVIVTSYDTLTGVAVINKGVNFYHFGADESTADNYNGVDMRGEVILLTRNLRIVGEDVEGWGCQFVTSDTAEFDFVTEEVIPRLGQTILDNVEFYNCSQADTQKAAIRFETAQGKEHSVTDSVIHNGLGWGVAIKNSKNVVFKNNNIFGFRPVGVSVSTSSSITFTGNLIGNIQRRTTLEANKSFEDKEGGFLTCTYYGVGDKCTDLTITNNIVAGSVWTGFTAFGHECGVYTSNTFKDNVAHSNGESKGGYGAIFIKDPSSSSQATCWEASHFSAYKNERQGAFTQFGGKSVTFSHMTMIDNAQGMIVGVAGAGYGELGMETKNCVIIGENPDSDDCPPDGSFCFTYDKCGLWMSVATHSGKDVHPTMSSGKPLNKAMSYGSWGGKVKFTSNIFRDFKQKTVQNKKQNVICLNPTASDYVPEHKFVDNTITNVEEGALAYLFDPPQKWVNPTDCVAFPCTAPKNVLMSFKGTRFTNTASFPDSINYGSQFQVISDNAEFSPYVKNCNRNLLMNAWICDNPDLGVLIFESNDIDTEDRNVAPIYVKQLGSKMNNKLNSMMDHMWDGFYTGQIHLSRFPALIQGTKGSTYDIVYTGTPPKQQRFLLDSANADNGVLIRIAYPSAESRQILVSGKVIKYTPWSEKINNYAPIDLTKPGGNTCGENRYVGVQNILEFYITAGCTIEIKPRDAIQTNVRMEWTMAEFYSTGGTTAFIDRVAASLGIHSSTIKVVSVYEGSLVIDYETTSPTDDPFELAQLKSKQISMFASNTMNTGAPVLDVSLTPTSAGGTAMDPTVTDNVVSDGVVRAAGYSPVIITKTPTNTIDKESVAVNPAGTVMVSGSGSSSQTVQTATNNDLNGNSNVDVVTRQDVFRKDISVVMGDKKKEQEQIEEESSTEYKDVFNGLVKDDSSGKFIMIGALVILFVILALYFLRYIMNKSHMSIINEAVKRNEAINDIKMKTEMKDLSPPENQRNIDISGNMNTLAKMNPADYDEQYDANHDFAIFANKDKSQGGFINLREKQNREDELKSNSSMESGTSDDKVKALHFANSQKKLAAQKLDLPEQISPNTNQNTSPQGLLPPVNNNKNQLPEDDEIQELE